MITEQDLQEAIAECEGQRNPNANTCIKLAAFYTIRDHLYGSPKYSYAQGPINPEHTYESNTEFFNLVSNKSYDEVIALMDEVMSTLSVINPRLYNSIISRLS